MTYDVEHLFIGLVVIVHFLWWDVCSNRLLMFKIRLFIYLIVLRVWRVLCIFSILLHVDDHLFQHHLLKWLCLFLVCFSQTKISQPNYVGLLLGSLFCSTDLTILLLMSYCIDYCSSIVRLEIRLCQPSTFFYFNIVFEYLCFLLLHLKFRIH